ncbi:MAG: DsrE family protein [Candidatus Bathyarchaeia archaeon]
MGSMLILIVSISGHPDAVRGLRGISSASVKRGHSVIIFFTGDGVNHLREEGMLNKLSSMGVRLLACRTSARERKVALEGTLREVVEISSLSMLVELLETCDRALFL